MAVKKLLLTFFLMLLTAAPPAVYADGDIAVYVDGGKVEFDVQPQIISDRTMVPMRKIFEALGAEVEWVGDSQMIFATLGSKCALYQIGKYAMAVNDFSTDTVTKTELDAAPVIVDGRTLVPVRAVSEAFGMRVEWDDDAHTVSVYSEAAE